MDVSFLADLATVREILAAASDRATWWQILRSSKFARLVRSVKNERFEEFKAMLESCKFMEMPVLELLRDGYVIALKQIINTELDFSTPGRVVASMAFLAAVMDIWNDDCFFMPDFVLDSVAVSLWQMITFRLKVQGLGKEEEKEEGDGEETTGR